MFASHEDLKYILFKSFLLPPLAREYGFVLFTIGVKVLFLILVLFLFVTISSISSGVLFSQSCLTLFDNSFLYSSVWVLPSIPLGCSLFLCHSFANADCAFLLSSSF